MPPLRRRNQIGDGTAGVNWNLPPRPRARKDPTAPEWEVIPPERRAQLSPAGVDWGRHRPPEKIAPPSEPPAPEKPPRKPFEKFFALPPEEQLRIRRKGAATLLERYGPERMRELAARGGAVVSRRAKERRKWRTK